MSGEELSRRRVEIINQKRFGELSEVLAPEVVTHYGGQELHGIDELIGALEGYSAFPDMRVSIEALVLDGDEVGLRYMSRATQSGTFLGIAPTMRTVAFGGASINRIQNGRIVETWTVDDLSALMRQIGDSPAPTRNEPTGPDDTGGQQAATAGLDIEAGKRLVRRWIELTNAHAFAELREVFAEDLVVHAGVDLDDVRGFPAFTALLQSFYVGMPDLQITVEDIVAAGDTVIMRSTSRATHTGELLGIPASGRTLLYTGVSTYQVVGGKLAVEWFNDDLFTLAQQLTADSVTPTAHLTR